MNRSPLPIDVLRLDHVAIATWDAAGPVKLLTEILGATFVDGADQKEAGFRWLQFAFPGGGKVEVIEPLCTDGFLYRFLTKRGEGLHHITVYVADLARAIEQIRAAGYEPVDVDLTHEFWKEAFIHPRDANGVLLQLAENPIPDTPNPGLAPLADYLADRPNLKPD
jgi:methylmalonyl-CoA/ethylmalonyl-CoA epimerase